MTGPTAAGARGATRCSAPTTRRHSIPRPTTVIAGSPEQGGAGRRRGARHSGVGVPPSGGRDLHHLGRPGRSVPHLGVRHPLLRRRAVFAGGHTRRQRRARHAREQSISTPAAAGGGTVPTDHVDPFHSSTNATVSPAAPTFSTSPTAVHAVADVHDTAFNSPDCSYPGAGGGSAGSGGCSGVHVAPFHTAAHAAVSPPPTATVPTTTHRSAATQDTFSGSTLSSAFPGFPAPVLPGVGVATRDQADPFQLSASYLKSSRRRACTRSLKRTTHLLS